MAKTVTKGDRYELRLARLLFFEGAFVRRAIDLNMSFGEGLTVTDLDLLAVTFGEDFRAFEAIGESKTAQGRKGPKLADRLLWLVGLRDLVGADAAFVATTKSSSDRVRGLARRLGVEVFDEADVDHREGIVGLDEHAPWGPFDPRLLQLQREIYDLVKSDPDLKRIYWFVRSEFWLLDTASGIKRAFGAIRLVDKGWRSNPDDSRTRVLRWLARQLEINLTVGLVRLAGRAYREDPRRSSEQLLRELAAGPDISFEALTRISGQVDRYVTSLLHEIGAEPGQHANALGAFYPSPPKYAESLIEVVERLAAEPRASTQLPRYVDWKAAEADLGVKLDGLPGLTESLEDDCGRLLRLIRTFVVGQLKADPELFAGNGAATAGRSTSSGDAADAPGSAATTRERAGSRGSLELL
jgi:hypothetical protein